MWGKIGQVLHFPSSFPRNFAITYQNYYLVQKLYKFALPKPREVWMQNISQSRQAEGKCQVPQATELQTKIIFIYLIPILSLFSSF